MSLVNFKKRMPWSNFMTSDFLDNNDFFNDKFWTGRTLEPALNIKENNDEYQIELAAPGYSKKDFDVNIDNGCLNISAKKTETKEDKGETYSRKEFSYDSFEKSLQLPENVMDEKIKAKYENGILRFSLAKKEEFKNHKPKSIEIS